jgi:uncharacterized protein (TIGR02145 family)
MAIPNKQIGWSQKSNLLWEISRELDKTLLAMRIQGVPTTTSTSTSTSSTTTTTTSITPTTTTTTIFNPCPNCVQANVIIGTQTWQKCNLNVETYRDGTTIPQVTDPTAWANLTTGAWCYNNNDSANGVVYGKLYNWYAVAGIYDAASLANPALRKQIAPVGYHVPSDVEWDALSTFLGGDTISGGKLKETGACHWIGNTDATNISGFTALPGGLRTQLGGFSTVGFSSNFWTSTDITLLFAFYRILSTSNGSLGINAEDLKYGLSVRCLLD